MELPGGFGARQQSRLLEQGMCAFGLMGAFLLYGILQERIMTVPYGDGERFPYSGFLVLNNRIVACLCAAAILLYKRESLRNVAPLSAYLSISVSNTGATFCQYEALKYVSFPTQTLGKCGKTIPVLILGNLIGGKAYGLIDYAIAVFVTLGCTTFLLTGDISGHKGAESDSFFGLMLIAGYLAMDGFTSVFQEKQFKQLKISTYNQMLWVNLCSGVISVVGLIASGQLQPAFEFSIQYPALQSDAFTLSMCAMVGQVIIYYSIKNFGALFFATVMTTRQVASMAISSVVYDNPLSYGQWFGALVVFGALYYQATSKPSHHGRPSPATSTPASDTKLASNALLSSSSINATTAPSSTSSLSDLTNVVVKNSDE